MLDARHILGPLRVVALWFLAVLVFFGLPGLGGSPVPAATLSACGGSCPCEAADHDEHADGHDEDIQSQREGREGEDPCEDECPDDCPNCSCGVPSAMTLLPLSVASNTGSCAVRRTLAPLDSPAIGIRDAVFRPPRFLS